MKLLLLFALINLFARTPVCKAQGLTWLQITPSAGATWPGEREGGGVGFDSSSNQLILFGGYGNETFPIDTWLYNVENGTWEEVTSTLTPEGRQYFYYGVVAVDDVPLFVVSHGIGYDDTGYVEYGDTWVFNFNNRQWIEVTTDGYSPGVRYGGHFGAVYGPTTNEFWMGGGFTDTSALGTRYIDTYKLVFTSQTAGSWVRMWGQPTTGNQFNPLVPHGRCLQGSAVVRKEQLVIFGGCMSDGTAGGPCPTNDNWYFNVNKWTELPRCITPRVWSHMAPLSNAPGKAVLYGGNTFYTDQIISAKDWPEYEVAVVDVEEKKWTRYRAMSAVGNEFPDRRSQHMMAAGPNGTVYLFGGLSLAENYELNDLWILSGDLSSTETMGCDDIWFSYIHLHGLFMAIAFGILFPTGFIIARYFRCSKSKLWFFFHFIIQILGVLFTIPAFVVIFPFGTSVKPTHPHAMIGIILETLTIIQPFIGIFRPHIKEDGTKSTYRKIWEWIHRIWGLSVIFIGLVQVTLGVFLVVPPVPVWAIWLVLLILWVITFVVNEIIKCIRQYYNRPGGKEPLEPEEHELKYKHP